VMHIHNGNGWVVHCFSEICRYSLLTWMVEVTDSFPWTYPSVWWVTSWCQRAKTPTDHPNTAIFYTLILWRAEKFDYAPAGPDDFTFPYFTSLRLPFFLVDSKLKPRVIYENWKLWWFYGTESNYLACGSVHVVKTLCVFVCTLVL
jgi:hypothetical protein